VLAANYEEGKAANGQLVNP